MNYYSQKNYLKRKIKSKLIPVDSTGIIKTSFDKSRNGVQSRSASSNLVDVFADSDTEEAKNSLKMLRSEDFINSCSIGPETVEKPKEDEPKVVLWNENIDSNSKNMEQIRKAFFQPVDISHQKTPQHKPFSGEKSQFSLLIEKVGLNMNPFLKYIQYDIKNNPQSSKVMTYSIKINSIFADKQLNVENVSIYVSPTTPVQFAIGLILYKMEASHPRAITETNLSCYNLYILDEDGVIDQDMPVLDHEKNIGNYQFPELAICCNVNQLRKKALINELSLKKPKKKRPNSIALSDVNLTTRTEENQKYHAIVFWSKGQSTLEFTDKDFTLRDLAVRFYQKRGQSAPLTSAFYVEHEENPGVPIKLQELVLTYEPPVFTLHMESNDMTETVGDPKYSQLLNITKQHHFFHGTLLTGKHKHVPVHVHVENKTIEYLPQLSTKTSLKRLGGAASSAESISITVQIASIISIEETAYRKLHNSKLVVVKYQEDKRTNKVTVLLKKEDANGFVKVLQATQQSLKSVMHSTII